VQQAFSYDNSSTLHSSIPALEALHKAWSSQAKRPKYQDFAEALNAAAEKIEEHYDKTSTSHAYTLVMCEYSFLISIDMFIILHQCLIPRKK